jgi:hypothetical protein
MSVHSQETRLVTPHLWKGDAISAAKKWTNYHHHSQLETNHFPDPMFLQYFKKTLERSNSGGTNYFIVALIIQGGGGSFKNRKPIGEVGCCESRMAERIH